MAELTVKQTTEYLKQISELETSVYKQTEVRKNAKKELKVPNIRKDNIKKPQEPSFEGRPLMPSFFNCMGTNSFVAIITGGMFFLICLFCLIGEDDETSIALGSVISLMGLAIVGITLLIDYFIYSKAKSDYYLEFSKYEKNLAFKKSKYEQDMKIYNAENEKAMSKYLEAQKRANEAYLSASKEVKKLDKPLEETQAILNKLYDADIIFPKYRNMVAMCTIYEYFASGRCTELTGATGAYNLYESELRQNLIINQLEEVNANLEQVRQNQYILYQGISETNKALSEVSSDIKGILSMTADIAVSSRINAFCSQITAANVKALTYMETYEYITQ